MVYWKAKLVDHSHHLFFYFLTIKYYVLGHNPLAPSTYMISYLKTSSRHRYSCNVPHLTLNSYNKYIWNDAHLMLNSYNKYIWNYAHLTLNNYNKYIWNNAHLTLNSYNKYIWNVALLTLNSYNKYIWNYAHLTLNSYNKYIWNVDHLTLNSYNKYIWNYAHLTLNSYNKYIWNVAHLTLNSYNKCIWNVAINQFTMYINNFVSRRWILYFLTIFVHIWQKFKHFKKNSKFNSWTHLCQGTFTIKGNINDVHGEVYSIQRYVEKFVSDLRQFGGFLRVLRFPLLYQYNRPSRYNWNIVEKTINLIHKINGNNRFNFVQRYV